MEKIIRKGFCAESLYETCAAGRAEHDGFSCI